MRATTILSVIGLMATAAYAAPADESMLENALDSTSFSNNPLPSSLCCLDRFLIMINPGEESGKAGIMM